MGFSGSELTIIATAISEVARNIVEYASTGELTISPLVEKDRVQVVFDGHGSDRTVGRATVRYSKNETADTVIERLAHRRQHERAVTVVSSDAVLRHVAQRGPVHAMSAREYLDRLSALPPPPSERERARQRFQLGDSVDPAVRDALERMRRGE